MAWRNVWRNRRRSLVTLFAMTLALGAPTSAWALGSFETAQANAEVIGALRLLGGFVHYRKELAPLVEDDTLTTTELRLVATGRAPAALQVELNVYTDTSGAAGLGVPGSLGSGEAAGAFGSAGTLRSPYRSTYLDWDYWRSGAVRGQLGIDRLNVTRALGPLDVTVGRLVLNHSVTQMFTPNDFFAPFSAAAINTIYKPGVDGARLRLALGPMSELTLSGVVGSDAEDRLRWAQSAVLARLATVARDFEWALLAGKVAQRWIVGASLQGELLALGVRAEGHVGLPDADGQGTLDDVDGDGRSRDDAYTRLAVEIDKTFAWRKASLGAEYAYFSDGARAPARYVARALRLFPDDQGYLGRHYAGANIEAEVVPILRLALVAFVNLGDRSGVAVTSLSYSIADEADLVGGLLVPWGEGLDTAAMQLHSEMGVAPIAGFVETRVFF